MGFGEITKTSFDELKELSEEAIKTTKNIDKRIDVKNILNDFKTKDNDNHKPHDIDSKINLNDLKKELGDIKEKSNSGIDSKIDISNREIKQHDDEYKKKLDQTPINNWTGQRGESKFVCDECKPYGVDGIEYKNAEPDFGPVSVGKCKISGMTSQRLSSIDAETGKRIIGNYEKYDNAMGKELEGMGFKKVDGNWVGPDGTKYTRHERCDGKTMELVPTEIHKKCTHSGGVSTCKAIENQGGEFDV